MEHLATSTVQSVQLFTILNLLAIGLSHLFRPLIWVDFFQLLVRQGNSGNILNAMLALGVGSFIFSFHIVWTWPMVIITLYGISQLLKGAIYLIFPSIGLKSISRVNSETKKLKWAGLLMSTIALLLLAKWII